MQRGWACPETNLPHEYPAKVRGLEGRHIDAQFQRQLLDGRTVRPLPLLCHRGTLRRRIHRRGAGDDFGWRWLERTAARRDEGVGGQQMRADVRTVKWKRAVPRTAVACMRGTVGVVGAVGCVRGAGRR